jgi:hypothetical protein
LFLTPIENCGLRSSRAADTYYNDNGRGSENITQRKNTAAGVWGTMLDNIEKYEVLINPIFCTEDRYTPSNSEYDVVSCVGE